MSKLSLECFRFVFVGLQSFQRYLDIFEYFFLCIAFRLEKFRDSFEQRIHEWKKFYDVSNPHEIHCPPPMNELKGLQRLVALRCVRPDKVVPAVQVKGY